MPTDTVGRGPPMTHHAQFYIGGGWVDPAAPATLDVVDPSTEQPFTAISLGAKADVDRAVGAAKAAFGAYCYSSRESRLGLLRRILEGYNRRSEDLAQAVSQEMGAPLAFAREAQVWAGRVHLEATIEALESTNSAGGAERASSSRSRSASRR